MDLIRNTSGNRSTSSDLDAEATDVSAREEMAAERKVEQGGELDREEFGEGDDVLLYEDGDGDEFEDAPSGVQQTGQQQQEGGSNSVGQGEAGGLHIRVRAPVTDETEENEAVEEDEEASFGSGESFDSALERMAASSTASFDTASPKISSPVGSLSGSAVLGDDPTVMSVAQQGALMRLNKMINGEPSLDTFVIDNSTEEEFRQRISDLAKSRNLSPEDASFGSIVDALLPLVLEMPLVEQNQSEETVARPENTVSHDGTTQGSVTESKEVLSPMPKATLSAEDEPYLTDEEENDDGQELADENGDKNLPEEVGQNGDAKRDEQGEDVVVRNDREVELPKPEAEEEEKQEIPVVKESEPAPEMAVPVSELGAQEDEDVEEFHEDEDERPGIALAEDEVSQYGSGDDADGIEDVADDAEAPVDTSGEPTRVRAMPVAKLTTEDDEPHQSEGDSEERENGDERDDDEEFGEDGQTDEDAEENGDEEVAQNVPVKVRAVPDPEPEEVSVVAPQPADNGVSKDFHEVNGDEELEDDHPRIEAVPDPIYPKLKAVADPEPEQMTREEAAPESESQQKLGSQIETQLKAENGTIADSLLEPEGDNAGAAAEGDGGGEEGESQPNEHPPVSSLPNAQVSDFGVDQQTKDFQESTSLPEDSYETSAAEHKSDDEAAEEKLPESKPLITEVVPLKDPSQSTEESITSPLKAKSEVLNEMTSVDAGDREEGDNPGDWDEEIEEDDEEDTDALSESSSALAALVRAADAQGGGEADTPSLGAAGPSLPARPTRVGRSGPSLDSASRAVQPRSTGVATTQVAASADESQASGETGDGNEETREKLQVIRVKFLRLALRLGQSAHNVVVAQVLYRLGLAEQLRGGRSSSRSGAFSFDRASAIAEEQEAAGPEELDFTCTIMLLGKTGVGKSATINSIFDEAKTGTNAFMPSTKKVQEIFGHVHGIKVRVIDTPGLLPSVADQRHNEKIMGSVKRFIKKSPPDIVLYFDRLDMQSRDYGDLPLLRTITDTFGAAVWFNAIVVLTHASSAPPDGPNGLPLSYEMFVAQRSHVVQQTIRQAAGDMRLMNPVSLVENHPACRMNRARQRVLPNGQVWKPQLLLLCFASKILAEANALLKLQDNTPGRPFGTRPRVPPLPFLLSSLLQSRAQLKLPDEQMGDEDESDEELEEDYDSDEEEDYDELPPFRRLSREEVAELDEDNRRNYFEELAERERLFQKKQWKEELKRRREMKRRMAEAPREDQSQLADAGDEEEMGRAAAVPVPIPDMALPPSFDSDNPSHRYRYIETANQWLVRPVLETHGWDHDSGYDGFSLEKMFVVGDKIPASVSGQITKDKKEANLTMEAAASLKHGEGKVTLAGLDLQTIGKDLAYTLRSETRFSNFKGNKTTGGLALTLLGDTVTAGMKIEDRLIVGKRLKLVLNGGAITGRGDVAYGGSLEATLRDKDYPLSRTLSTLGLSIMDWHGDLAIGGNLQSQFVLGKTMMVGRANLNNRGAGQISIRASSSEQLQMALIGLLPIIRSLANRLFFSQSQQ